MKPKPLRITVLIPGDLAAAVDDLVTTIDDLDRQFGGAGVVQSGFVGTGRRVVVLFLPKDPAGWPERASRMAAEFRAWANRPLGSGP